jgi:hypothetical protein
VFSGFYGAAQLEFKEKILTELVQASVETLILSEIHVSKIMISLMPFLFKAIIDGLDLREIEMSERKFTGPTLKVYQLMKS